MTAGVVPAGVAMCMGMPPGYESPCGVYPDPHGPHPIETRPATRRAQVIASMHALADYLAEHPEHPTPDRITLHQSVTEEVELDEAVRAYSVTRWTLANGGNLHQGTGQITMVLGEVTLMSREGFGVDVTYSRYAHHLTERYVDGAQG